VDAAGGVPLTLALERERGSVSVFRTAILPHESANIAINERYVERLLKFLLWQKGGFRVTVDGPQSIADYLRRTYSPAGPRAFDYHFMGESVYGREFTVEHGPCPEEREAAAPLGRHLEGFRIGFDLGASDRKCAAVIDGKVVFSDEVGWNPAVQSDPQYHYDGVHDSLRRAAAHLPRVDAIAAKDAAGKLWIAITNLDPNQSVDVEATLSGATAKSAAGETLTAPNVDSINTFDAPKTVAPKPVSAKVQGSKLTLKLEPKSVTVISVEQ
jgi:hypothetical protein